MATLSAFNEKFGPRGSRGTWSSTPPEFVATQALVMADAEGVTELPVIGRFLRVCALGGSGRRFSPRRSTWATTRRRSGPSRWSPPAS